MSHSKRFRLPLRIVAPALLPAVVLLASCKKEQQAGPAPMPPAEVSFIEIKSESVVLKKELPGRYLDVSGADTPLPDDDE